MDFVYGIALGVIQGLTEFLPVSSSGHLVLAQKLLGLQVDSNLNIFLHLGTLLAVVVCFKTSLLALLKNPLGKKGMFVFFATACTLPIAMVVKLFAPQWLTDGSILPFCFLLSALLLFASQKTSPKHSFLLAGKHSPFVMGVVQGFAVLPGISRSGATVSVLMMCGVKKESAVELSFLCSIPVILAACLASAFDCMMSPVSFNAVMSITGLAVSFAVGVLCLKFLKAQWQNGKGFVGYLLFLALLSAVLL